MKRYIVELHKRKWEKIAAENPLDLVERVKALFPGYEIFGFKLDNGKQIKIDKG